MEDHYSYSTSCLIYLIVVKGLILIFSQCLDEVQSYILVDRTINQKSIVADGVFHELPHLVSNRIPLLFHSLMLLIRIFWRKQFLLIRKQFLLILCGIITSSLSPHLGGFVQCQRLMDL